MSRLRVIMSAAIALLCLSETLTFGVYARATAGRDFVKVRGTHFEVDGKPYYFIGTNFWYGMNLASKGPGGDRARLIRELDRLHALGINNLRILGGSEGPDTEPWRIVPALQIAPGVYDKEVLDGLDYLLYEMGRRHMRAVVVLNNFWPWSGGMAQYLRWSGASSIPYPPPARHGSWARYQKFTAEFFSNPRSVRMADDFVKFIVKRENPYTKARYADDPTIMAWELANEPRGIQRREAFEAWINQTSAMIKSMDSKHLVTTGCEGTTPWPSANGLDFVADHQSRDIDYATMHIWAQNWGWYDPSMRSGWLSIFSKKKDYPTAQRKMLQYFEAHSKMAESLGKPLVLEEFGLARDLGSFQPLVTTAVRDSYYAAILDNVLRSQSSRHPVAGANFWAWAGEGRSMNPGDIWRPGDSWIGDPPHELQGWYSVYNSDKSTIRVVSDCIRRLNAAYAR